TLVVPSSLPDVQEELARELADEDVDVVLERRGHGIWSRVAVDDVTAIPPVPASADRPRRGRFLYVIARDDSERYRFVRQHFADQTGIEIVHDRRGGERRVHRAALDAERRRAERRHRDIDRDLRAVGWALVAQDDHQPV